MNSKIRLLRKPVTTVLWLLLGAAAGAFLLVAVSMWLSTNRMAEQLDKEHTAIAARIDPRSNSTEERHFTKEDAARLTSLDSVEALRLHTVSAAASPDFHPLIEMNRHEGYQGNGDRRPYCNAVFSGTVDVLAGTYVPGNMYYINVTLDEILLLGEEYCGGMAMADNALRYDGRFQAAVCFLDQEAADYIRAGQKYVFSGYYDVGANLFEDPYMNSRHILMLGGVRMQDGILMGGYDCPDPYYSYIPSERPEQELHPDTVYAFPAAEHLPEEGEAAADPDSFFEETEHEIWRTFRRTWDRQQGALPVIGTDKLETMYSFLSQRAVIKEGRSFTEEEYDTGARVLIVSRQIADRAGLKPGDTVTLEQYIGTFEYTGALSGLEPLRGLYSIQYGSVNNPSVDILNLNQEYGPEESFTLVGIYELEENWAEGSYDFTPNTVFMPRKAQIAGAAGEIPDEGDFFGLTFSFELVNGKIDEFQAALEASPYSGEFYTFDQGYEAVLKNLNVTVRSMGRLLILSACSWCFFQIFYLLMYQGSEKKTVGTMRSLGASRSRCGVYLWSSGFIVALGGILLGSAAGRRITEQIRAGILEDALGGLDPDLPQEALLSAQEEIRGLISGSSVTGKQMLIIAGAELLIAAVLLLLHTGVLIRRSPRRLMEG